MDVHVLVHPDGWAVRRSRTSHSTGIYVARRFAVDAGRQMAQRDHVDLLVFGEDGQLDLRESYSDRSVRSAAWKWRRGPRRQPDHRHPSGRSDDAASAVELLRVNIPYDSWCLRTARAEAAQALAGLDAQAVEELLMIVTELVLRATVQTRTDSTLTLHRHADEVRVAVNGAPVAGGSGDRAVDSVWATYALGARCAHVVEQADPKAS